MAKTFDQAVCDATAFTSFSARNAKFVELEALIAQIGELKLKGVNTRATKNKFYRLNSNLDELSTELKADNKSMCTAIFKLNTNMNNDPKFKADQTAFRNWLGQAEDALSELHEKLEETGMDIPIASPQAPPVSSDINAIILQMSKQQESIHKQLSKQYAESQKDARESQAQMADKLAEALKISRKPKFT